MELFWLSPWPSLPWLPGWPPSGGRLGQVDAALRSCSSERLTLRVRRALAVRGLLQPRVLQALPLRVGQRGTRRVRQELDPALLGGSLERLTLRVGRALAVRGLLDARVLQALPLRVGQRGTRRMRQELDPALLGGSLERLTLRVGRALAVRGLLDARVLQALPLRVGELGARRPALIALGLGTAVALGVGLGERGRGERHRPRSKCERQEPCSEPSTHGRGGHGWFLLVRGRGAPGGSRAGRDQPADRTCRRPATNLRVGRESRRSATLSLAARDVVRRLRAPWRWWRTREMRVRRMRVRDVRVRHVRSPPTWAPGHGRRAAVPARPGAAPTPSPSCAGGGDARRGSTRRPRAAATRAPPPGARSASCP